MQKSNLLSYKPIYKLVSILLSCLIFNGCSSSLQSLDFSSFSLLPTVSNIDLTSLQPSQAYDYWELRQAERGKASVVLSSGGAKTKSQLSSTALEALNTATANKGFNIGCQGQENICYKYIVAIHNDTASILNTAQSITNFLGSIDNISEAALLTSAYGYTWDTSSIETGSYLQNNSDFNLIVLRLTNLCLPVQLDRFQLQIDKDAHVSVVTSEQWQTFANNCFQ